MDPDYIFWMMIQRLTGTLDREDAQYLNRLLERDPSVRDTWHRLLDRFSAEDIAGHMMRFNQEAYWQDMQLPEHLPARSRRSFLPVSRVWAWAAILIVLAGAGGYLFFNTRSSRQAAGASRPTTTIPAGAVQLELAGGPVIDLSVPGEAIQAGGVILHATSGSLAYTATDPALPAASGNNILRVPAGCDYQLVLSDGTQVWLNAATEIRFPFTFTGPTREITLNGEAYLKVAQDAGRPFIVHTPRSAVQVLGTEFNVNTYDTGQVKVALVAGAVKLQAAAAAVIITPGQEAVYTTRRKGITIQGFDEEEALSWRQGIYCFNDATIAEMCRVLPRWYGIPVVLDDAALAQRRFQGVLERRKPVTVFLDLLKELHILDHYFDEEGTLHLVQPGPAPSS